MKYLLVLLLVSSIASADTEIDDLLSVAENNVLTPSRVRPEIRNEVIVQLRAKLLPDDPYFPRHASDSLVSLGDEQTIEKIMRLTRESRLKVGRDAYNGDPPYSQPLLIPYWAEDFSREDGEEWEMAFDDGRRVYYVPISIGSVLRVLSILRKSAAFNEDVHKWVEGGIGILPRHLDMPKCRNIMRTWWRENEGAFTRRDYSAVKPGAPLGRNLAKAGAYDNDPAYTSQPTPNVPVAIAAPSTALPSELGSKPHGFITVVALSILAIAAGGFYFLRKK